MDATALAKQLLESVPANRRIGLQVVRAADGCAQVAVADQPQLANMIGSMHSSGLVAIVDAAGLAAFVAAAQDANELQDVVPLGATANLQFLAPGRGRLIGHCELGETSMEVARSLLGGDSDSVRLTTSAEVLTENGVVVCRGSFGWRVKRLAGARP
ncbi:MAG: DUF4442 domain-containing protein [Actinomycetota bacterium]|nr:DUF4442 domain-containing protein [Actinomycetota bacterium]